MWLRESCGSNSVPVVSVVPVEPVVGANPVVGRKLDVLTVEVVGTTVVVVVPVEPVVPVVAVSVVRVATEDELAKFPVVIEAVTAAKISMKLYRAKSHVSIRYKGFCNDVNI